MPAIFIAYCSSIPSLRARGGGVAAAAPGPSWTRYPSPGEWYPDQDHGHRRRRGLPSCLEACCCLTRVPQPPTRVEGCTAQPHPNTRKKRHMRPRRHHCSSHPVCAPRLCLCCAWSESYGLDSCCTGHSSAELRAVQQQPAEPVGKVHAGSWLARKTTRGGREQLGSSGPDCA